MHQKLPVSYKNKFPFKLGTTSFIYRDHYVPNVEMLAPYVDEIELLVFDSAYDDFPSKNDITRLSELAGQYHISYNIHLPVDVSVTASELSERNRAVEAVQYVIDLAMSLTPSTFTLHVPYDEVNTKKDTIEGWQEKAHGSIKRILENGINSRLLSIETLDYPFHWVEPVIETFNLSACLDFGHLIVYGYNIKDVFDTYAEKTSIIHLHGVNGEKDHIALNNLSEIDLTTIMNILKTYSKTVSLELFSYDDLNDSLAVLKNHWEL